MHDQPLETSEREAVTPTQDVAVGVPADRDVSVAAVLLTFAQMPDGIRIELNTEGEVEVDPRNPMHALALYVQHNPLAILPNAALWLMELAKQNKLQRAKATPTEGAQGLVAAPERQVVGDTTIVAANGEPLVSVAQPNEASLSPDPAAVVAKLDADPDAGQKALAADGSEC